MSSQLTRGGHLIAHCRRCRLGHRAHRQGAHAQCELGDGVEPQRVPESRVGEPDDAISRFTWEMRFSPLDPEMQRMLAGMARPSARGALTR